MISYDMIRMLMHLIFFFFSSRRRHTRYIGDWSSDVCSSDLVAPPAVRASRGRQGAGVLSAGREGEVAEEIGRASCRERGERGGGGGRIKRNRGGEERSTSGCSRE